MFYIYDDDGFLSGSTEDGETPRTTSILPPKETKKLKANFTGDQWVLLDIDKYKADKNNIERIIEAENVKLRIKTEIDKLEDQITVRRIREAFLGTDNGWLSSIDSKIEVLRAKLNIESNKGSIQ